MNTSLKQQLNLVHAQLSELRSIDTETRQLLLVLLADISRLMEPTAIGGDDVSPTEALDTMAARFDVDHPALSTAIRQLIDALAKAGI